MRNFLFILLCTGCGENLYFSDDEAGPRHEASATGAHDDDLSLPYALGTRVGLTVKGPESNSSGWTLVSDSPGIFTVNSKVADDGTIEATGSAAGEGDTYLRLLDGRGNELRNALVSVRAADRARLFSHGDLRIVSNDDVAGFDAAEVSDVRILAGGKAVLAVAYYRGSQRVYGRGIAQTGDPSVQNMTSSSDATNEWLFITPAAPQAYTVSLRQGSTVLAQLAVTALPESALSDVTLSDQEGGSRNDKDATWALARAHDGDGREVLGVYCDWTLDGAPQKFAGDDPHTQGDLYRYRYAADKQLRTLAARRGPLSANLTISAYDGSVNDTTYLGCSYGGGRARPSLVALAALFLLLSLRKRNRSSGIASDVSSAPATNERGR